MIELNVNFLKDWLEHLLYMSERRGDQLMMKLIRRALDGGSISDDVV